MTRRAQPSIDDLRAALRRRSPGIDLTPLERAWPIAQRAHRGQYRLSGDPYVTHPLVVASFVAEWGEPLNLVCAALLHDVPVSDLEPFVGQVGADVLHLVEALTELEAEPHLAMRALAARRIFEPELVRNVIILKLADRLHNARTWRFVPPGRAAIKAHESLDLLVPLAAEVGLAAVGAELAELARATLAEQTGSALPQEPHRGASLDRVAPAGSALAERLLRRALSLLPDGDRQRYGAEWVADLATMANGRQRLALAIGLLYSAGVIRRDRRRAALPRPSS